MPAFLAVGLLVGGAGEAVVAEFEVVELLFLVLLVEGEVEVEEGVAGVEAVGPGGVEIRSAIPEGGEVVFLQKGVEGLLGIGGDGAAGGVGEVPADEAL